MAIKSAYSQLQLWQELGFILVIYPFVVHVSNLANL
jgi:hypothetical protein